MSTTSITPRGPFSLAESVRFLEGFTPASYDDAGDDVLRLAFPSDDGHPAAGAAVRQDAEFTGPDAAAHDAASAGPAARQDAGSVRVECTGPDVTGQVARILSLDVDGRGYPAVGDADPVVAELMAEFPGLRPVCFHSPYEAAAWAIIGHRIRMTQAATIKARLAERHGEAVEVAGHTLHAFPAPPVLRTLTHIPGLTDVKVERLHALADATEAGALDAARLRSLPVAEALAELRTLPGIGPFSAELILIRGAGHPDVFARAVPRLHEVMARAYGAGAGDIPRLETIAERWRPYRSWVTLLLRASG